MPFWPLCCESKAVRCKSFVPVTRAGVFIWENFHPDFIPIPEISVTLPARLLICTHQNSYITTDRVAGRDFGNRASPVDWAHMNSRGP